jgi:hypothetical protein
MLRACANCTICALFLRTFFSKELAIMSPPLPGYRLGWIGLGRMGHAMISRLAQAGAAVSGYNRTRAKALSLVDGGIELVDRPADLAGHDIVFSMVSTAADLRAVLTGDDGLFTEPSRAPKILVELTTISPDDSAEIRAIAAARGTQTLAVPVSGNDVVARAGRLSIIASGPRASFDVVSPYLACFGASVIYVGDGRRRPHREDLLQRVSWSFLRRAGRDGIAGRATWRAATRVPPSH